MRMSKKRRQSKELGDELMIRVSKKLKRRLAGIVAILVLYAVFFKEIVLFCGCVASCLFLGFYDWRVSHEEIMEGDYVKGEIKVWKSGDEVMVTNACELGSEITQWKYCKHATCYKVADIFVPKFGLMIRLMGVRPRSIHLER